MANIVTQRPQIPRATTLQQKSGRKSLIPLFYIAIPILASFIGLLSSSSNTMLFLLPLVFLPTAAVYTYYLRATRGASRVRPSKLAIIYLVTGTIGTLLVGVYSSTMTYLLGTILFGREFESYLTEFYRSESDLRHADPELIAKRAHMAAQPTYWIFLFIMSFDIIAFSEEFLKYISLPIALKYLFKQRSISTSPSHLSGSSSASTTNDSIPDHPAEPTDETPTVASDPSRTLLAHQTTTLEKVYIPIIVAATLGFSTVENIGFIYGAATSNAEPALRLVQTVLERIVLAVPAHSLGAIYIGTTLVGRNFGIHSQGHSHSRSHSHRPRDASFPDQDANGDRDIGILPCTPPRNDIKRNLKNLVELITILAYPIAFHGAFDFLLLGTSAWNGNVGWVHPRTGMSLGFAIMGVLGLSVSFAWVVRRRWVRYGIRL